MKNKILAIFVGFLVISMFAIPVMAAPTTENIEYFRKVEISDPYSGRMSGESHVYVLHESVRHGSIYVDGDDTTGTKIFTFTQWGKLMMYFKQGKAIWKFYMVWTSTSDPDSGFKGKLNGDAVAPLYGWYTVSGVLQGYGDLQGQKLIVEMARIPPNDALITGTLVTN
jgi:hypothetical protein